MGRKPRIEFNGAVYHVIQRGNNKEYIFRKADYKKYFLNKIKGGSRVRDITNYKKLYIKKALSFKYSMKEIGNFIGISDAAVCKLANKE